MERTKRSETIESLKNKGFKVVKGEMQLYINSQGNVYDLDSCKDIKPLKNNNIETKNGRFSIPKLVLQAFANEHYRNGQITYIDGNKSNLSLENVEYSHIFPPETKPEPIRETDILTAIRCYFQVNEKFNVNDSFRKKMYLKTIADMRGFFIDKKEKPYIEVFKSYLTDSNTTKIANIHNLKIRDYQILVNKFINLLVKEVLQDLEAGKFNVIDFNKKRHPRPQQRRKSTTEKLKDFQKKLSEYKDQTVNHQ